MNRRLGLGLLLAVIAGALALRLPSLDRRPMHNDEGLNAAKIQTLWEQGRYTYDPKEFHGPTLYYATLPFVWLSGARDFEHLSETTLRLVTVAFGAGLIVLLVLMADGLGWPATICAAVLTAISPAMVFYSRYFIHEMLLVFFTALLLAAGWRYARTRHIGWAMLAGAALGLMYSTKETFVIAVAATVVAAVLTAAWNRWLAVPPKGSAAVPTRSMTGESPAQEVGPVLCGCTGAAEEAFRAPNDRAPSRRQTAKHTLAALAIAALVSLILFTSFFTNLGGPLDSVRTYLPWLHRVGGASPHIHPWPFYLERLVWFHPARSPVWSEGFILVLAIIGATAALAGRGLGGVAVSLARFLALDTLLLSVAYSAISYKTPWCLLGFLQPMILLAGIGGVVLIRAARGLWVRAAVAVLLAACALQLGWQAYRASYLLVADRRNPYVYAQTVPNILELVDRVQGIAKVHPAGRNMEVKVIAPESYWPLPWYLRQLKQVGWWDQMPADPYAPVVITSATLRAALDDRSNKKWLLAGVYEVRPGVFLELYVEFDLWRKYVDGLPRPKEE